jgi:hypothetical protein
LVSPRDTNFFVPNVLIPLLLERHRFVEAEYRPTIERGEGLAIEFESDSHP